MANCSGTSTKRHFVMITFFCVFLHNLPSVDFIKNPVFLNFPDEFAKETLASWWFKPLWKILVKIRNLSPTGGENKQLHPRNLTWNLKTSPQKRKFLLETIIFRFHVKFRGSIWLFELPPPRIVLFFFGDWCSFHLGFFDSVGISGGDPTQDAEAPEITGRMTLGILCAQRITNHLVSR